MAIKTQLIGGSFQDSEGNLLANGTLTMELSQDAQVSGVGQICSGVIITIQLDSNANVASSTSTPPAANQFVWGNDVMSPANTFYTIKGFTAAGQLAWGPNVQQIVSGSTFNVSGWTPNTIVNWTPPTVNVVLQTNEVNNGSQSVLDLHAGAGIALADNGSGQVTITASGGAAGSLSGSATIFSGQNGIIGNKTLDISTIGTLDWFIPSPSFSGTNGIKGTIKRGTTLSGWLQKFYNDQAGSLGAGGVSSTTISSDAADSANGAYAASTSFHAINPASGVAANLGMGFRISAPADSQTTRNLNLYLCAWPGAVAGSPSSTVTVTAFLIDGSATPINVSFNPTPSNGNVDVWTVNLQFKGGSSTVLEVKVEVPQQTSGSSTLGLLAAALF